MSRVQDLLKHEITDFKCTCGLLLPRWGTITEDFYLRCDNCKKIYTANGKEFDPTPAESIKAEIKVDWYTQTGKWYSHGLVEVNLPVLDSHKLKQDIVDNQTAMSDNWVNSGYYVVVSTTDNQDQDSYFQYFCNFLLMHDAFTGMMKSKKEAVNT